MKTTTLGELKALLNALPDNPTIPVYLDDGISGYLSELPSLTVSIKQDTSDHTVVAIIKIDLGCAESPYETDGDEIWATGSKDGSRDDDEE